ncbi:ABC transporter substrate-binding protein [Pelagicoccus albus]|uniref:Thiamine pyrimidine synthase n=1 Tax=Pelagicoccus albus TaxID=415222 RepID=A0A7X1B9C6_9BACT|nr:ABC transporter substrate-binding protein [Pelagicoccus albus]MBC2607952.1 ABC transporter substrate-binding protein [Pelagicoccus albus]
MPRFSRIQKLGAIAGCLFLVACGDRDTEENSGAEVVPISLQPDWYAQPEQGGFYFALAEGLYDRADLRVTILDTAPNLPFLQKVAKGEATVGITRLDLLAAAVEKGLPLVVIGKYSEHAPSGIMVPAGSDIHDFADLDGKRVMATIYAPYVNYLQSHFGIKMRLIPHNWGMAQFVSGELDAQQCYITSEPYHVKRQGMETRTLIVADAGYDPPHVLYTSRETLEANKDALLRFFEASMAGWKGYLEADPSSTHELIAKRNPKMDPDFMDWSRSVLIEEGVISGRRPEIRETWGKVSREEVSELIEQLLEVGELSDLSPDELDWVDFDFSWEEVDA